MNYKHLLLILIPGLFYSCANETNNHVSLILKQSKNSNTPYVNTLINNSVGLLHDIKLNTAGTEGWAIGDYGLLFHFKNGKWKNESFDSNDEIYCLWMNDSCTEGWVVTSGYKKNTVLHYLNNKWQEYISTELGKGGYFKKIVMNESGTIGWAIDHWGSIFHYQNSIWKEDEVEIDEDFNHGYNDIWISKDGSKAWVAGDNETILKYKNGKWDSDAKQVKSANLNFIQMNENGTEGWAAGGLLNPVFMHYENGKWNQEAKGVTDFSVEQFWMNANLSEGWAIDIDNNFLHFKQGQWKLEIKNTNKDHDIIFDLSMNDNGTEGWAVGLGNVYHYKDFQWKSEVTDIYYKLGRIWMNTKYNECWAVGAGSTIAHYKDGKWAEEEPIVTNMEMFNVWLNNKGNEGWAVGEIGTILKYSGGRWKEHIRGLTSDSLSMIQMNESVNNGFAVSNSGQVVYYNGEWKIDSREKTNNLHAISMNSDGQKEGWALSDSAEILHYKNGKWVSTWHEKKLQETNLFREDGDVQLNSIWMNAEGTEGWVVGSIGSFNGIILHYENNMWRRELLWDGHHDGLVVSGGRYFLNDIWMNAASNEGWAIGNGGTIFHYLKKRGWKEEEPVRKYNNSLQIIKMNNSGTEGWAAGRGILLHYKDGVWEQQGLGVGDENLSNLWINAEGTTGFASYGNRIDGGVTLLHYQNNNWEDFEFYDGAINEVAFSSNDTVYAFGHDGLIVQFLPQNKDTIYIAQNQMECLYSLKDAFQITFKNKIKSLDNIYLAGLDDVNLIGKKHYESELQPNGFTINIKFKNTEEIIKRYAHEKYRLGFKLQYAKPYSLEPVMLETVDSFQILGPSPLIIVVWSILGFIFINVLLVLLAVRFRTIRWLILHPKGSRIISLYLGKYAIYDLLIHFFSPIRLAMFKQYRAELLDAPFIKSWKAEKTYIPPSININGLLVSSSNNDEWIHAIEYILSYNQNTVWMLIGRSGLGKTALLEKWVEIILRKGNTPIFIRLGTEDSAITNCLTSVQHYGDVILNENDLLDIIKWGGFVVLLDGINEDNHSDQTIKFIKLIAKRNVIIVTGQDKPLGFREMNTKDVSLSPFGLQQMTSLMGKEWAEASLNTPYLSEIIKLPQTAHLLALYIKKNNILPSFSLDIYADLAVIKEYQYSELVEILAVKAWDLFAKQEITFDPDNSFPINLCEATVGSGILTKTVSRYTFRHERIHRYFVAWYIFSRENIDIAFWNSKISKEQNKIYWADVIEYIGEMLVQQTTRSSTELKLLNQQKYHDYIAHIKSFSFLIFKERVCPQFIYYLTNGIIDKDINFLLLTSQWINQANGII